MAAPPIGRVVCVFPDSGPVLRGTVRAIASDLSLVLEGVETPVASGRLAFAEECARFEPLKLVDIKMFYT